MGEVHGTKAVIFARGELSPRKWGHIVLQSLCIDQVKRTFECKKIIFLAISLNK